MARTDGAQSPPVNDSTDSALTQEAMTPNGRPAPGPRIVAPPAGADPVDIVRELNLGTNRPVILIIGGADAFDREAPPGSETRDRLHKMFGRKFTRVVADAHALLIDGGTDAGVMALVGQAIGDQSIALDMVGVAPAGKVQIAGESGASDHGTPLEPSHSHVILIESDVWGGETPTLVAVAAELAGARPVTVILIHGGAIAKDEVLRCVRRGWTIVVVEGSGGLADELAKLYATPTPMSPDWRLDEVISDGRLLILPESEPPAALARLISRQFGNSETIRRASEMRELYAFNARLQQTRFKRFQLGILGLAVVGPLLALVQQEREAVSSEIVTFRAGLPIDPRVEALLSQFGSWLETPLKHAIVLVPLITVAIFLVSTKINPGATWFSLRSSAEAIKSEIFRYRTRTGVYSDRETTVTSREEKLARKLAAINDQLSRTAVSKSSLRLPPPKANAGNDLGILDAGQYVTLRLDDQRQYYQNKIAQMSHTRTVFWIVIGVIGLAGGALAAIGLELWIVTTSAFSAALIAYLQYLNTELTLIGYNEAANQLANVDLWWSALTTEEARDPRNLDRLVESTEAILTTENRAWRQQMEEALQDIMRRQFPDGGDLPGYSAPK